MLKFTDLNFQPHYIGEGIRAEHFFSNGYGVSVVRFPGSYGYEEGLYEVAVLKGTADDFELCYDTDIADDVVGHCNETDIENIIQKVQSL
jgi:hypothetical protein